MDKSGLDEYGQQQVLFYMLSSSYCSYVSVDVKYTQLLVFWFTVTQKCLGQAVSSVQK